MTKSRIHRRHAALAAWLLVCSTLPIRADDWLSFRGPDHNGVTTEQDWSSTWPATGPPVLWRKDVGIGVSSFVVAGQRAITMGSVPERNEESVVCLDANTGEVLWEFRYQCPFDARNFEGGTASTPTIRGPFVYTLSYTGQFHCLALDSGELVWRRHLVEDFGGRYSSWKYAGSPLVVGDYVILDTGGEGNSTVALERTTGRQVWGTGDDFAGYSTPIPFTTPQDQAAVLVFKARAMVALTQDSGRELWRIDWRTNYDCNASSPTVVADKLFISSGYGGRRARGALYQLTRDTPQQLWVNDDIETKMNSAVIHQGFIYCVSEKARGQLMCVDLRDGHTVWAEPSFDRYGTLLIAAGKLIVLDEQGDLVIAAADPTAYHELARWKALDGRCWSMPVLANGRIFARNNQGAAVCVDVRGE